MLRAAFKLFSRWRITDAQARMLLGWPSASTYKRWREGRTESIPNKTIVRVVDLLNIHNALCIMFREPEQGDYWISRPNKAFGGRSALDRMLDGTPSDIRAVRSYLEGRWDDFFSRPGVDLPDRLQPEHQTREPLE